MKACVLMLALVLAPPSAAAQSALADLSGTVTDTTGARVAGVSITTTNLETATVRRVASDGSGRYRVPTLAPGDYRVDAASTGFAPIERHVRLTVGENAVLDLAMSVAGREERVDVVGENTSLRDTSSPGTVIDREQVLELPVNGRSYEQLVLMAPGVVGPTTRTSTVVYQHGLKIDINGAGSRSNLFLLDGTAIGDLYNNGIGSAAGTLLGIEAVREFRVLTNSYPATYGGVNGGIISIVTKSGSNSAHGSAFEFLRNDALDARNFFDTSKPDLSRHQFGGSAGGAAVSNRLFYFATAEGLIERLGMTQVTTVPSMQAREGRLPDPRVPGALVTPSPAVLQYLDLFPLPNGPDFGGGLAQYSFPVSRDSNQGFGQARVDVPLKSGSTVFARYTYDRATRSDPASYPGLGTDWSSTGKHFTLEATQALGMSATNLSRFSVSSTEIGQIDTTLDLPSSALSVFSGRPVPHLAIGGMPTFGSLVSPRTNGDQRVFALADDATFVKGGHLVKWGALVERYRALVEYNLFLGGRFTFADVSQFLQARPSTLIVAMPGADGERDLTTTQFGAYAQDELRLNSNLSVTAGLRWEFSTDPREREGRLVGLPDPLHDTTLVSGTMLQTPTRNLEPRLAFAWTPGAGDRTVVRGGVGVFYDINTLPYTWLTAGTNPPWYTQVTLAVPRFPNPVLPASIVPSLAVPQYDWANPRTNHFNVAVERELAGRTRVTAAYAGARGFNLVRSGDINAPIPQTLADGTPFFPAGAPRRNPSFGAITYRASNGHSWYDSLQISADRSAGAVRLQGHYTLARTIDEGQGIVPTEANGSLTSWMDPDSPARDKGPADYDRRHNAVVNAMWDMPAPSQSGGLLEAVLRDWSIAGILTLRTGTPFTVGIQGDYTRTLFRDAVHRPNLKAGFPADRIILGTPDQYFDPNAFELQLPGTFGNVTRNSLVGPGLASLDLSLSRRIGVPLAGRSAALQLRLEAFNVLNRANFDVPQRIVFAGVSPTEPPIPTAGRITATTTAARQLQLGAKLVW